MLRSFSWPTKATLTAAGPRFWLQTVGIVLLVLNAVVLFLYLDPPGGTQKELSAESESLRQEIRAASTSAARVENVAAKVQSGSSQAGNFAGQYFLPNRLAYDAVLSELQRMAAASDLKAREAVFNEEAVEGSADLSVMNITSNFEGTYPNLMRFLHEVDRSPMLLMLDTLQVSPQQHGNQINSSIRFQAIVHDDVTGAIAGGQQ